MTKWEAYREAERLGASFLSNVILNWHNNPAKKLKGLVNLLKAGHSVTTGSNHIDVLIIDGYRASWVVLEEWTNRKS